MPFRRPRTLAEVVQRAEQEVGLYDRVREFLDHFYTESGSRQAALEPEPALTGDAVADAYLAAVAEHLALSYDLEVPAWVHAPERFLHRPHFAGPEGMKAVLLAESPLAFRRRMIFVDYDPLARPRRREPAPVPPPWGRVPGTAAENDSAAM
jgi:hypothetical protein